MSVILHMWLHYSRPGALYISRNSFSWSEIALIEPVTLHKNKMNAPGQSLGIDLDILEEILTNTTIRTQDRH